MNSIIDRLEPLVEKVPFSGCWIWMGYINPNGYASAGRRILRGDSFQKYEKSTRLVTRAIYEETHGTKLQKKQLACHTCDVRCCINPSHIFIGTHLDNTKDAIKKGVKNGGGLWARSLTHCMKGHEFSAENIYWYRGGRRCIKCKNVHTVKWNTERAEKRKAKRMAR